MLIFLCFVVGSLLMLDLRDALLIVLPIELSLIPHLGLLGVDFTELLLLLLQLLVAEGGNHIIILISFHFKFTSGSPVILVVKLPGILDTLLGGLLPVSIVLLHSLAVLLHCIQVVVLFIVVVVPTFVHFTSEGYAALSFLDFFVHAIFFRIKLSEPILHHSLL